MASAQSGIISVAMAIKDAYSGSGYSSGPQLSVSNTVALSDANVDGVYFGTFKFTGSVTRRKIEFGHATNPLTAVASGGTVNAESGYMNGFNPTTASPDAKLICVYFELYGTTDNTKYFHIWNRDNVSDFAYLGKVGDCILMVGQCALSPVTGVSATNLTAATTTDGSTLVAVGSQIAGDLYINSDTGADFDIKVIGLYRNAAAAT